MRARREPRYRPVEYKLQCTIADTLRKYHQKEWLWTHFPAGELRTLLTGARLKRMGLRRGLPDFLLFAPNGGRPHFLELKREGEDLTVDQQETRAWCLRNDVPYAVAATVKDAVAALSGWDAVKLRA